MKSVDIEGQLLALSYHKTVKQLTGHFCFAMKAPFCIASTDTPLPSFLQPVP